MMTRTRRDATGPAPAAASSRGAIYGVFLMLGLAAAGSASPRDVLSPTEEQRILEQLCLGDGEDGRAMRVTRDGFGLVCKEVEEGPDSDLTQLRWSTARRGRFVAEDGEWLVSLSSMCRHGCAGTSYILRKAAGRWKVLLEEDGVLVDPECVTIRDPDGFEEVACLRGAGPHQGFMTEWLEVTSFARGEGRTQRLLFKEHGGECYLAAPPEKAEYDGDRLLGLSAPATASSTALAVRLQVRRLAGCDQNTEDPEARAAVRAEHTLGFVRRGGSLVPDAASAALIQELGWSPQP